MLVFRWKAADVLPMFQLESLSWLIQGIFFKRWFRSDKVCTFDDFCVWRRGLFSLRNQLGLIRWPRSCLILAFRVVLWPGTGVVEFFWSRCGIHGFLLCPVCHMGCFCMVRLCSFFVDSFVQSAQSVRNCFIPFFDYTLVFQGERFVGLVEVMLNPHVSLLGASKFCVFFCYSGGIFFWFLKGVFRPIVTFSDPFC